MCNLSFCSMRALKFWWGEGIQPWSILYPRHIQNLIHCLASEMLTSNVKTRPRLSHRSPTLQALGCVFVTCSKFITGLLLTLCSGFPPRAFPSPLALSCRLLTSPPALRLHKHFAGFSFSNTLSIILTSSYIQLPVWLHKQLSRGESCGREEPSSSDQLFGYTYALWPCSTWTQLCACPDTRKPTKCQS